MPPPKAKDVTIQEDTLLAVVRGIAAAHKLVDGGTRGIPEQTSDTDLVDELNYVLRELRVINEQCEKNKVEGVNWESLNVAARIAAIAKSRKPTTESGATQGSSGGDLPDLVKTALALTDQNSMAKRESPSVQMKKINEDLQRIKTDLNNAPVGGLADWRDMSLVKKTTFVVNRLKASKASDSAVDSRPTFDPNA